MNQIKEAIVCKDSTGYWVAIDRKTGERVDGRLHESELQAYQAANFRDYVVR